jgi:hypothetical protein
MEKVPAYILIAPVTDDADEYRAIVTTHKGKPMGMMEIEQYSEDEDGWVNVDLLYVNPRLAYMDSTDEDVQARFEAWLSRRNGKEND